MRSKRNQTIAIARFLLYKSELNRRLESMSDEETVDKVLRHQSGLIARLGDEYRMVLAHMPYEKERTELCTTEGPTPIYGGTSLPV